MQINFVYAAAARGKRGILQRVLGDGRGCAQKHVCYPWSVFRMTQDFLTRLSSVDRRTRSVPRAPLPRDDSYVSQIVANEFGVLTSLAASGPGAIAVTPHLLSKAFCFCTRGKNQGGWGPNKKKGCFVIPTFCIRPPTQRELANAKDAPTLK
jgi:hypothetical protein